MLGVVIEVEIVEVGIDPCSLSPASDEEYESSNCGWNGSDA